MPPCNRLHLDPFLLSHPPEIVHLSLLSKLSTLLPRMGHSARELLVAYRGSPIVIPSSSLDRRCRRHHRCHRCPPRRRPPSTIVVAVVAIIDVVFVADMVAVAILVVGVAVTVVAIIDGSLGWICTCVGGRSCMIHT